MCPIQVCSRRVTSPYAYLVMCQIWLLRRKEESWMFAMTSFIFSFIPKKDLV